MENDKFDILKSNVQEIIDMIASNNAIEANNKLVDVSEQLDDLLDHSEADEECCEPYIKGLKNPETAVVLMRSRYSAYATQHADYLIATTHSSTRKLHSKAAVLEWSISNQWVKLEVLNAIATTVEFKAFYLDSDLKMQITR